MHPQVFQAFERICAERGADGSVLEVGAVPSGESLLCLESLAGAREKVGVSLDGPSAYRDFRVRKANANDLGCFEEGRFDTVLCNSVLEHDPFFWKSAAEMRRVAKPGGLIVIGVPGFVRGPSRRKSGWTSRFFPGRLIIRGRAESRRASTPVLRVHDFPSDYYRFSPAAVSEVLLAGLEDVRMIILLNPPRIVGSGLKP
jgi:SAM-dependent methyltransferase